MVTECLYCLVVKAVTHKIGIASTCPDPCSSCGLRGKLWENIFGKPCLT